MSTHEELRGHQKRTKDQKGSATNEEMHKLSKGAKK